MLSILFCLQFILCSGLHVLTFWEVIIITQENCDLYNIGFNLMFKNICILTIKFTSYKLHVRSLVKDLEIS